jgi:hypothetical protein
MGSREMKPTYEQVLAQVLLDGRICTLSSPRRDMRVLLAYTDDWAIASRVLRTTYTCWEQYETHWRDVWEACRKKIL